MQTNRKSLLDSINPKVSAFIEEGRPKTKQEHLENVEKIEKQEASLPEKTPSTALKPFTCMVSADLMDEMMMISAKRKISKQRPYSQKDIISEALSSWINKNK